MALFVVALLRELSRAEFLDSSQLMLGKQSNVILGPPPYNPPSLNPSQNQI